MAAAMCEALTDAAPALRKAYLNLFVDKVVISKEEIRVSCPKAVLALAATGGLPSSQDDVITFIRQWRPVGDSNPCYRRESRPGTVQRRAQACINI